MELPARTTINQAVALIVFACISAYGWHKDMIFKPDPAVPIKTKARRSGDGIFLLPTMPALYAAADNAAQLQGMYDDDKEALIAFRSLAHFMLHEHTWERSMTPQFVDIGSPHGLWTLYSAAVGLHSFGVMPRRRDFDKLSISMNFNFPRTAAVGRAPSNRALAGERSSLYYNETIKNWAVPSDANLNAKEVISASTFDELVGTKGRVLVVHVGTHTMLLPTLQGVLGASKRPPVVLVDFFANVGAPLNFQLDAKSNTAGYIIDELKKVMYGFGSSGYSLGLIHAPLCPLTGEKEMYAMGITMQSIPDEIESFAADVVAAAEEKEQPKGTCRFVLFHSASLMPSNHRTYALLGMVLVGAVVVLVVMMCIRRQKKAEVRTL